VSHIAPKAQTGKYWNTIKKKSKMLLLPSLEHIIYVKCSFVIEVPDVLLEILSIFGEVGGVFIYTFCT